MDLEEDASILLAIIILTCVHIILIEMKTIILGTIQGMVMDQAMAVDMDLDLGPISLIVKISSV